jgi:hypothetical protein
VIGIVSESGGKQVAEDTKEIGIESEVRVEDAVNVSYLEGLTLPFGPIY